MADEASAAAAPAKEEKDSKKRARDKADEADDEMPEMPEKWAKKDIGRAMLWYYRDKAGKRQGPFYPGQMRHWWTAGFFQPSQLVAPSFRGEVPRAFVRVDQFFTDAPAREAAFVAAEGVALWPAARAAGQSATPSAATKAASRAGASVKNWSTLTKARGTSPRNDGATSCEG